ncbi:hypothetical protein [Streptacidiphilus sp. P02-A3a]|uniref:hypothetical protein n=1 Tax=Streptacidiphilus sp. P02-A3a TaxID=2704468 RepID=UPI0015F91875|nr:hypothetical protein [Streptacidiphilus sp. P02-A3a]QMU68093.1 hypothetical protein GXP74_07515 [Streptacidiphilus sp. P02-A3a]
MGFGVDAGCGRGAALRPGGRLGGGRDRRVADGVVRVGERGAEFGGVERMPGAAG